MTDKGHQSVYARRLIEDMEIRRPQLQDSVPVYPPTSKKFADFLGRSADKATRRGCPSLSVMAGLERGRRWEPPTSAPLPCGSSRSH